MSMKRVIRGTLSVVATCAMAGVLAAQEPQPRPAPTPQDPAPRPQPTTPRPTDTDRDRANTGAEVTVTGCLKAEKDVPGRSPNVAERAGIAEDFILTSAKVTRGQAPAGAGAAATGRLMFKVEGLDDEKLRSHVNQQVEVKGRFTSTGDTNRADTPRPGAPNPTAGARNADEVPDINASSIKMIAQSCSKDSN